MKIKNWNSISRAKSPKWNGWKILDFYESINIQIESKEHKVIKVLEENFILVQNLKRMISKDN